jgi:hypothetical protein
MIEKYAKNDYLYPKDNFLLRSIINERLFFNASFLFPRGYNIFVSNLPSLIQSSKSMIILHEVEFNFQYKLTSPTLIFGLIT